MSQSQSKSMGYVYIVRLSEYSRFDEHIYKIGQTCQEPNRRLSGYPKKSEIHLVLAVNDQIATEKKIIEVFKQKFIQRTDIGREYFEGNIEQMKKEYFNIVSEQSQGKFVSNEIMDNGSKKISNDSEHSYISHGKQSNALFEKQPNISRGNLSRKNWFAIPDKTQTCEGLSKMCGYESDGGFVVGYETSDEQSDDEQSSDEQSFDESDSDVIFMDCD